MNNNYSPDAKTIRIENVPLSASNTGDETIQVDIVPLTAQKPAGAYVPPPLPSDQGTIVVPRGQQVSTPPVVPTPPPVTPQPQPTPSPVSSSADDGKTRLFKPQAAASSISVPQEKWVLGWLVAITGPLKGKSFTIGYGFNTVGRDRDCQISLEGDNTISRRQIIIYYRKKQRQFYVEKAPESTQMTEMSDGDIVTSVPTEITAGEILKMSGLTTLRFIPFCGEDFTWDYSNI